MVNATLKGVLFDNDGTLVDTYELILSSYRHALKVVANMELPAERIMKKVGQPLVVQAADILPDQPELQERLIEEYRSHNEALHDERIRLFDGVREGLDAFSKQGLKQGLVTSKRRELAAHGLTLLEVVNYMDCLVGFDDCTEYKPNPQPVEIGCQRLGLMPSECVYVGDSPYDLQAGKSAGCKTIGVTWGMFDVATLEAEQPDAIVSSFEELVSVVNSWR